MIILKSMHTVPALLIAAFTSIALGQSWKVIRPLFSGRRPEWNKIFQSGGMPSGHTAFAAAMAVMAGFRDGLTSSAFALALILTVIVTHDAVKVRGTIHSIITILRQTAPNDVLERTKPLPKSIGHTVPEVAAGLLLAGAVAVAWHLILP